MREETYVGLPSGPDRNCFVLLVPHMVHTLTRDESAPSLLICVCEGMLHTGLASGARLV